MKTAHEILSSNIERLSKITGQIALLTAEADAIKADLHKCAGLVGEQPFTFFEARPRARVSRRGLAAGALRLLENFDRMTVSDLVLQMVIDMPEPVSGLRDQRKSNAHRDIKRMLADGFLIESADGFITLSVGTNA